MFRVRSARSHRFLFKFLKGSRTRRAYEPQTIIHLTEITVQKWNLSLFVALSIWFLKRSKCNGSSAILFTIFFHGCTSNPLLSQCNKSFFFGVLWLQLTIKIEYPTWVWRARDFRFTLPSIGINWVQFCYFFFFVLFCWCHIIKSTKCSGAVFQRIRWMQASVCLSHAQIRSKAKQFTSVSW